jgi:2-polyprenyl-3-methyl-5-hydroxy-6-metoxy-1,4-benzoquinol methylase
MNGTMKWFLNLRGVHFFATRLGPKSLRKLAFDEKYSSGDWDFSNDGPKELMKLVESHANKGHILIMGCGGASILKDISPEAYASVLGVDLSTEAIRLACQYAGPKISFQQADMTKFNFPRAYDLVLFSESIYYIPFLHRKRYLQKICQHLTHGGSILVTISQSKRYRNIFSMIRNSFEVLTDRQLTGSTRRLILFQPKSGEGMKADEKASAHAVSPK